MGSNLNLETTLSIYGGGLGSGCQGPNCGRKGSGKQEKIGGHEFMKELWKTTFGNPFDPRERVVNNESAVTMKYNPNFGENRLSLNLVRSFEKGKGAGGRAMDFITKLADKHKMEVQIDVKPVGKGGLGTAKLMKFYAKFGFVKNPQYRVKTAMIRYPK